MQVLDISLPDGTGTELNVSWSVPNATGPLRVSSSRNSFVALGCNVVAQLIPYSALGPLTYASFCAAIARSRRRA
nr:unnamed protein product [Digitaria exilis]